MIVHINGFAGVGKLTAAKLLSGKLNAGLIDNHKLIELVTAVCERGSAEYISMMEALMDVVLDRIASNPERNFVFTNSLAAELSEDRKRLDRLIQFSKEKDIAFVQVILSCDLEENKQRIVSETRRSTGKLTDAGALDELYQNYTMYHPSHEYSINIDTTGLTSDEITAQIENYIKSKSLS